jgi:hypothetical protein
MPGFRKINLKRGPESYPWEQDYQEFDEVPGARVNDYVFGASGSWWALAAIVASWVGLSLLAVANPQWFVGL